MKTLGELIKEKKEPLDIKIDGDQLWISDYVKEPKGILRVVDEESECLFEIDERKTVEDLEELYTFYKKIDAQGFKRGFKSGQNDIKNKIKEVVGFFTNVAFLGDIN